MEGCLNSTLPVAYFGGKSKVAKQVWAALGDVQNFIEPFFGSGAVLLGRPRGHKGKTETVNDIDQFLANFYRSVIHDADAVAEYADYPINEAELLSRHLWLVSVGKQRMQDGMVADPDWYDAKIAGWWLWGLNQWLGSGWCHGKGPWEIVDGKLKNVEKGGRSGKGVSKQLPQLSNGGVGQNSGKLRGSKFYNLMEALAWRMRFVRVACGDWTRVVTDGVTDYGKTVGVFLDPPYTDTNDRSMDLYANDSPDIAHEVREWAIANGDRKNMRIVLAGYEGEHDMPDNWRKIAWVGNSSFSSPKGGGHNEVNRHRERLWFSPHCLVQKPTLFDLDGE